MAQIKYAYSWELDSNGEPCNFTAHQIDARGVFVFPVCTAEARPFSDKPTN